MLSERLTAARRYLNDARYLQDDGRFESAVSRAYYAGYQAMWAALGEPSKGGQWRHIGIISYFVRGCWRDPYHPETGPGLLQPLRFSPHRLYQFRIDVDCDLTPMSARGAEECIEAAERAIAEIERLSAGAES